MIRIGFIRHGLTEWNKQKRIQGLRDTDLSSEGLATMEALRAPALLDDAIWYTSPLARARQTAEALGIADATPDPRLTEMDWAHWEGRTVQQLRDEDPAGMKAHEDRGIHFRPPGGESPVEVQARVLDWARNRNIENDGGCGGDYKGIYGVITHKGVIRAALASALSWDMLPPEPVKLKWTAAHILQLNEHGMLEVEELNVPLRQRAPS